MVFNFSNPTVMEGILTFPDWVFPTGIPTSEEAPGICAVLTGTSCPCACPEDDAIPANALLNAPNGDPLLNAPGGDILTGE